MTPLPQDRWQRVKACTADALDLDPAARDAYITQMCAGDAALEAEVRSLLGSVVAATPYFEKPPARSVVTLYEAGRRMGPYRIVQELATGGMGSVYLAERVDGDFDQRVAIKIVRGGFATPFLLERFREERRILATLEHANIARLLDGGTTDTGLPYVVMEYVDGRPIDVFCRELRLTLRDRLRIFRDVCAAVQYAHQHLVIHRDIKTGNILVMADGTPKLLDFGIAKLLDEDANGGGHTTIRIMTPESASPEQLSGKPVSVAADVYALGVLLYRMIAERSPYGETPPEGADLIRAVCEETPEPPSAHAAPGLSIPADVDRIVMKALRKEPERRYASADALSADVQRFLDGRPVLAAPDSWHYRARKFMGRHRLAVAASAALTVAVAGGVAATVWQAHVADRERTRAEREFNSVRGFAQAMLGEVHEAVSKLPGSTVAREILLRRGTEYLDKLSAEAANDDGVRREVAMDYLQLSKAQGGNRPSSIGDGENAHKSLAKAVALLEPLVRRPQSLPDDRVRLATVLATLAPIQPIVGNSRGMLNEARALLDSLTPAERSNPYAVGAREIVWYETAAIQTAAGDYASAEISQKHFLEAAEERLKETPNDLSASYNVSLACKSRGSLLEMLNRRPEALVLYARALALDQQRVTAEPWNGGSRLDLSFSEGSIAAAHLAMGDFEAGRAGYERAVAAREYVVRQDPNDDFARVSLARGYDRLAGAYQLLGEATPTLEYHDKALRIYRDRLDAHPERDTVWREYANATYKDVQNAVEWIAQFKPQERAVVASWAEGELDRLQALQHRWSRDRHAGELPPAAADIQAQRAIINHARAGQRP